MVQLYSSRAHEGLEQGNSSSPDHARKCEHHPIGHRESQNYFEPKVTLQAPCFRQVIWKMTSKKRLKLGEQREGKRGNQEWGSGTGETHREAQRAPTVKKKKWDLRGTKSHLSSSDFHLLLFLFNLSLAKLSNNWPAPVVTPHRPQDGFWVSHSAAGAFPVSVALLPPDQCCLMGLSRTMEMFVHLPWPILEAPATHGYCPLKRKF